jgi:hypothetical protein
MKFEKIIDGLTKYINANLYPTMNDWQKLIAVDVVGRAIKKSAELYGTLQVNPFVRALGYIDSEGNVDIEGIVGRIKEYAREKGKIETNIPFMPAWKFTEQDIDEIYRTIIGG